MVNATRIWMALLALLAVACAEDAGGTADGVGDARSEDAAPSDAGGGDARPPVDAGGRGDGGGADARASDGGSLDAGTGDAQTPDAEASDARATDAQTPDAQTPDAEASDAQASDAQASDAQASDAGSPVPPLDAPAGVWSWQPIEGMACADGQPTGIGLNPGPPGARRLMVYLIGGGACWDADSCYRQATAAFVEQGFGAAEFGQLALDGIWFFNRDHGENPFADHHLAFVPYCTGDIHAGDRVANYGGRRTAHVGARNFAALSARLAATWPDLERVVVVGGSAGGYGALLNWHRARAAFAGARVDVIDDAGAPIGDAGFVAGRGRMWAEAWNLAGTLPGDCAGCVTDWTGLWRYNLDRAPTARGALLTAMADGVIREYMGLSAAAFRAGVEAQVAALGAEPRFGAFLIEGDTHVLMASPAVAGGQTVPQWIGAMQADGAAGATWATVGPSPLPACEALADCNACAVCAAQGPCAAEYAACEGRGQCVNAAVCALGCAAADQACLAQCALAFPGGEAQALALYTCVRCGVCGDRCGACP